MPGVVVVNEINHICFIALTPGVVVVNEINHICFIALTPGVVIVYEKKLYKKVLSTT